MTNMEFDERNGEDTRATPTSIALISSHEKNHCFHPGSDNSNSVTMPQNQPMICAGCQKIIVDKYYMYVDNRSWHEACVTCTVCKTPLAESCYSKNHNLYCTEDYKQLQKCRRCSKVIPLTEFVLHVNGEPCHLICFSCSICNRALQSGDQYLIDDSTNQIYCKPCYDQSTRVNIGALVDHDMESVSDTDESDDELFSHGSMSMSDLSFISGYGTTGDMPHLHMLPQRKTCSKNGLPLLSTCPDSKRIKRPRTILTTAQRRKFKASFEVSQKPSRKVRETLAAETGLSPRVVQVWFQNQRAKVKKIARRQQGDGTRNNAKNNNRPRRKKTTDSDSENELSSPSSYTSMTTSHPISMYQDVFQSPGSIQTSPNANVVDATSFCPGTSTPLDSSSAFLYEDLEPNFLNGNESFVTQPMTRPAILNLDSIHQPDSRTPSDYNNCGSSCPSAGLDGDFHPEPSPQDNFQHFGTLQTLTPFLNHSRLEGNPIDKLMCMQSTFFTT